MDDDQRKHLEMLQAVIARMVQNSFAVKGWAITICSALFALSASGANRLFAAVAVFPALVFCALDAYYLALERSFRAQFQGAVTDYRENKPATYAFGGGVKGADFFVCVARPAVFPLYLLVLIVAGVVWYRFG